MWEDSQTIFIIRFTRHLQAQDHKHQFSGQCSVKSGVIFADTHDVTEGVDDNGDAECDDQSRISHPAANDKIACNTEL